MVEEQPTEKSGDLDIVDVYDPATDTWAKAKNMNHARSGTSVCCGWKDIRHGAEPDGPRFQIIQVPFSPVKYIIQKPINGLKKNACPKGCDQPMLGGGFRGPYMIFQRLKFTILKLTVGHRNRTCRLVNLRLRWGNLHFWG